MYITTDDKQKALWFPEGYGSVFIGLYYTVDVRRFQFQAVIEILLDVKHIFLVVVPCQLIVGVLCQVILVGQKGPDAAQLEDALAAVHDGQLIPAHELVTRLLIRCAIAGAVAAGVRCVVKVDRLFP